MVNAFGESYIYAIIFIKENILVIQFSKNKILFPKYLVIKKYVIIF